jgi:hypothetical protein
LLACAPAVDEIDHRLIIPSVVASELEQVVAAKPSASPFTPSHRASGGGCGGGHTMDEAYIASVRQQLQIAALGRSATGEWIQKANPGVGEIHHIACHHRQLMQHRDGSDLFVYGVLGIRYM